MNSTLKSAINLGLSTFFFTASLTSSPMIADAATANASLQAKQLIFNGQEATVYGAVVGSTTYMPVWYVMQALKAAGFQNTWNGNTWNITLPQNRTVDWSNLSLGTGSALIELNGRAAQRVVSAVLPDPNSHKPTTYMPIWYVMHALNRAGITSSWNGRQWTMTWPDASSAQTGLEKMIFLKDTSQSIADVQQHYSSATTLAPSAYSVTSTGGLVGGGSDNSVAFAHSNGKTVCARFDLSDKTTLTSLLGNAGKRAELATAIAEKASQAQDDGVNIDFEFMPTAERANFVSFLSELHTDLGAMGKTLSVDLPAVTNGTTDTWDAGYDFHAIGQTVDDVIIMGYDYSYPTSAPGPIAPVSWVQASVVYATSQIPSSKILLGLDTYAYDWGIGKASAMTLSAVEKYISLHHIQPQWNGAAFAPYYTYQNGAITHTVYYETPESITPRLNLVSQYQLRGIAVWRAGLEDTSVASTINQFEP